MEESIPRTKKRWRMLCGLVAALLLGCGVSGTAAPPPPSLPPLSAVPGSPRLPGKFVWADLVTDDVPKARAFYEQLFGWTFRTAGNYSIAENDERPLAGMFQRPRPTERPAQARWFGYISVSSVSKAQRAVVGAGGKVLAPPQDYPRRGEQTVFADPEGAVFGVMKSSSGDPEDFLAEPGDWIWVQLLSRDGVKAAEFYRAVAGYDVVANAESSGVSDLVLVSKGYARATVRTIPKERAQVSPNWLPFVRVANVSESTARATQLGGKVLIAPKSELLDGKVAMVADPTGAAIGIMEWTGALAKGGQKP